MWLCPETVIVDATEPSRHKSGVDGRGAEPPLSEPTSRKALRATDGLNVLAAIKFQTGSIRRTAPECLSRDSQP